MAVLWGRLVMTNPIRDNELPPGFTYDRWIKRCDYAWHRIMAPTKGELRNQDNDTYWVAVDPSRYTRLRRNWAAYYRVRDDGIVQWISVYDRDPFSRVEG